jgi:Zn-dependent protease with chaperone function
MDRPPRIASVWFDGLSPRPHDCELHIEADELVLTSEGVERRYPVRQVRWAERSAHGQRQSELPDAGLIQHAEAAEWDAWRQASGQHESAVVGWMQSWRATLVATAATVLFLAAAWAWGVPWLSQILAQQVPRAVEARLGEQAMLQLSRAFLKPSALTAQEQAAWQARMESVLQRAYPLGDMPSWRLSFHQSPALGVNAFALPGGQIVITDALVQLLADQPDALVGVFAHELGHVHHRHGLELMVRASLIGSLLGLVLGDAGGFLAALPASLATQSYARDAERQADAYAARLLHNSGLSPAVIQVFFERMEGAEPGPEKDKSASSTGEQPRGAGTALSIAIASHPSNEQRIRFFLDWRADAGTD